jgi:hypothetical protein
MVMDPRPPPPQVRELLGVKCRPENILFYNKNNFHSSKSIQGVIRPLGATLDARDTPGNCAAAPTR